jgi:hypothetical protein
MKIAMLNILGNIPTRLNSHNAGWTFCLASIIEDRYGVYPDFINDAKDIENYDYIVINNGISYKKGKWNFFGGVQDTTIDKLKKLSVFKGKLISYNEEVEFKSLLKRKEITKIPDKNVYLKHTDTGEKLILGDSHSLSIFKKGYSIKRIDGKTLNGFLKIGLHKYLKENVKELIFYAGNIDIRFHVHRFGGRKVIVDLIKRLFIQLENLNLEKITLVCLLPIEDESRKIPGTGLYKGKPFFGTKENRTYYVKEFNSLLKRGCTHYGYNLIEWDFDYDQGLSFDNMESRQSVHLKPKSYKFLNELL